MATPTPIRTPQQHQPQPQPQAQQQPLHHIKSAARKLPIKRKPSSPPPASSPNPSSSAPSTITTTLASPQTFSIIVDDGDDGGNLAIVAVPPAHDVDDEYDAESDGAESDHSPAAAAAMGAPAVAVGGSAAVPFKFHRIWSEADEIRFLEGLLACHAEGLVFPRDLNLFFDRFRGTMTTPYSRSQLSEKLRRLRKKFRIASARIARGLSPAAMTPHDRALYDLSARLWHPSLAEGSPFAPPGTDAPKRRRRVPPPLEDQQQHLSSSNDNDDDHNNYSQPQHINVYHDSNPVSPIPIPVSFTAPLSSLPSPLPLPPPLPTAPPPPLPKLENGPSVLADMVDTEKSSSSVVAPQQKELATDEAAPPTVLTPASVQSDGEIVCETDQGSMKQLVVKAVLDVFDDAVKDVKLLLPPVPPSHSWTEQLALVEQGSRLLYRRTEFASKWQEQRVAELNAVASRLKLVIERAIQG